MHFFAEDYKESVAYYEKSWRVMDETLLRLCREHPDHTSAASVFAKLWIIGRSYATGIERKIATDGTQGSSMSQLATHFLGSGKELDRLFDELRTVAEPLAPAKLRTIVSVHGRLVALLRPITRRGQSPRSFVSKYIHFHNPAVPIYDSVAVAALSGVVRWNNELMVFDMPGDADEAYGWYVMRFFQLYKKIESEHLPLTVKYLDNYLLGLGGSSEQGIQEPTGRDDL